MATHVCAQRRDHQIHPKIFGKYQNTDVDCDDCDHYDYDCYSDDDDDDDDDTTTKRH